MSDTINVKMQTYHGVDLYVCDLLICNVLHKPKLETI